MKELVIKYLNNELSDSESTELAKLLEIPENRSEFKKLVKVQYRLNAAYSKVNVEKALEDVLKQTEKTGGNGKLLYLNWIRIAAVIVVFLGAAYFTYDQFNKPGTEDVITLELEDGTVKTVDLDAVQTITDRAGNTVVKQQKGILVYDAEMDAESLVYNTLKVPYGKKISLHLSDNSRVMLNAGSELRYPVNFLKEMPREVFLTGEAYFEVEEDSQRPFLVNSDAIDIKVLGTVFNVSAYPQERAVAVLVSGKIEGINPKDSLESIAVKPGELLRVRDGALYTEPVNIGKYIAWTQGKLVFLDDSFPVIVKKLERHYNVSIKNEYPSLNDKLFTATFKDDKSIEEVLGTFQKHTPFHFEKDGNKIIISKPKSNPNTQ